MIKQVQKEILSSFKSWLDKIGPLSLESWKALSRLVTIKEFEPHTRLLDHNDEDENFIFIYSGIVKSEYYHNGTSYVNDFYLELTSCSRSLSLITSSKDNKISLTTISSCILIILKKAEVLEILPKYSDLQHAALTITNSYTSRMVNQMCRIRLLKAEESYQFLLENCPSVAEHAKQIDIASYLNVTPSSFSRSKRMMLNV